MFLLILHGEKENKYFKLKEITRLSHIDGEKMQEKRGKSNIVVGKIIPTMIPVTKGVSYPFLDFEMEMPSLIVEIILHQLTI